MNIEYAVQIIWSPEDGAYLAIPAQLPGCVADGVTPEEALKNLKVVIAEWIEVAKEEGREIPKPHTLEDIARLQMQATAAIQEQVQKKIETAVQQLVRQITAAQPSTQGWAREFYSVEPEEMETVGVSQPRRVRRH